MQVEPFGTRCGEFQQSMKRGLGKCLETGLVGPRTELFSQLSSAQNMH